MKLARRFSGRARVTASPIPEIGHCPLKSVIYVTHVYHEAQLRWPTQPEDDGLAFRHGSYTWITHTSAGGSPLVLVTGLPPRMIYVTHVYRHVRVCIGDGTENARIAFPPWFIRVDHVYDCSRFVTNHWPLITRSHDMRDSRIRHGPSLHRRRDRAPHTCRSASIIYVDHV
jgi:hypothetical protein